jgi:hypothetical protein
MAQLESSPESTLREGPISLMTCLAPTSNAGGHDLLQNVVHALQLNQVFLI